MKRTWLRGLACVTALSAFLGAHRSVARDDDSIHFHENYADAIREARATGKPIFLAFRCAP